MADPPAAEQAAPARQPDAASATQPWPLLASPLPWGVWSMAILLAVGVVTLLWYTRFGPAVTGDAVQYIAGARSLLEGQGFGMPTGSGEVRPITAFPPLFSTVLAGLGLLGLDPLIGARLLNAALFGANGALTGLLAYRHSGSGWLALLCAGWVLSSQAMLSVHAAAMTEPLFILLALLCFYSLSRHAQSDSWAWLLASGVLIGLASLTRYVGLSLALAGALALMLHRRNWAARISQAGVLAALSAAPFLYWSWRNIGISGSATARPTEFLLTRTRLALELGEVSTWFLPESMLRRTRILLLAAGAALLILALLLAVRALWKQPRLSATLRWFPMLLLAFILAYLLALGASMAFLDASMGITLRYLSPALIALELLVGITLLWRLRAGSAPRPLKLGMGLLAGGLLAFNAWQTLQTTLDPEPAFGYTDSRFSSGTIALLQSLDPDVPIVTNEREKVYILTGRAPFSIPVGLDHFTQQPRPDLPQQMQAYRARMAAGAVLALFDNYLLHQESPTAATLIEGLVLLADAEDGSLYVDPQAWEVGG